MAITLAAVKTFGNALIKNQKFVSNQLLREIAEKLLSRKAKQSCRCAYLAPVLNRGMLVPGNATLSGVKRDDGAIILFAYPCNLKQGRRNVCVGCDHIKRSSRSNSRAADEERNVNVSVWSRVSKSISINFFREV